MRAVVYARYSSDLQREASTEDQIRLCKERIAKEGWRYLHAYTDRRLSGASVLRPAYQQMMEDARAGRFDVVVAEALDRLSRDQEDVAALHKRLCFVNVRIVTLAEGEITELHVGLKGTMNALFLKDLAAKTHRGLRGRVEQGRSGGGLCFGYDVLREVDGKGEPVRGARAINTAEAETVRRIFSEFAAGRSPRAIARRLNAESVPGPMGRPWADTTIRGHHTRRTGILRNEMYIGRLVWNRQRYLKDPATGKRLARPNPESEWIVEEVPDLRIVDQGLWDRVQRVLGAIRQSPMVEKQRESRFWERRRVRHLLTDRTICGLCGGGVIAVGQDYLACGKARRQGTCSNKRGMRRHVLEGLILDALKRQLMAPELVKEFIAAFHEEVNHHARQEEIAQEQRRQQLIEVSRKLDGLIAAIADGLRTHGLQAKLEQLEAEKASLEAQFSTLPASRVRLHPNLAQLYREKVEALHLALAEPQSRDEALGILRELVERVVLTPAEQGFEIELVGEIAKMIELPGEPGSSVPAAFRSSVKVVAGRGFEPLTFRL